MIARIAGSKTPDSHGYSSLVSILCCVGNERLITRSEESYRACVRVCVCARLCVCVCVCLCLLLCDLETSTMSRPTPEVVCCVTDNNKRPLATRCLSSTPQTVPFHRAYITSESSSLSEVPQLRLKLVPTARQT